MMKVRLVPVTALQQNCAILSCDQTDEAAVVDPGGDIDSILSAVEQLGVKVTQILLTHGHFDHAGAATELSERLGLEVVGPHSDDQFWLDGMAQHAEMFGLGGAQACTPNRYLKHGDRVQVGKTELQVLHCPGHTPGHLAFFDGESKVVILGDLLFCGSIGRTDFPRSDPQALLRSLKENILPLGDEVTFHCGHGPSGTLGHERRTNPFLLQPGF
jgi:hydroxyacylglutathione hydrolase